jgi:hypothetical protein
MLETKYGEAETPPLFFVHSLCFLLDCAPAFMQREGAEKRGKQGWAALCPTRKNKGVGAIHELPGRFVNRPYGGHFWHHPTGKRLLTYE